MGRVTVDKKKRQKQKKIPKLKARVGIWTEPAHVLSALKPFRKGTKRKTNTTLSYVPLTLMKE